MKAFLDADFLLESRTARQLYHEVAAHQPIIDYHCHLSPEDLANDRQFANLTEVWLEGDHYKWRAMRTHGVAERYCTGDASPAEKFAQWAETVPFTLRNPLYHWTHLELQRYFGIDQILSPQTADAIYQKASNQLQTAAFSARGLVESMQVEVICTTDDPTDDLAHHQKIATDAWKVKVFPSFRPDKALQLEDPEAFNAYMNKLSTCTHSGLDHFIDLLSALQQRIDYFHDHGCRLSDHGLERMYAAPFTDEAVNWIYHKIRLGNSLTKNEQLQFKSALLLHLGEMYQEKGWVQQFHLGAMRNNNPRMMQQLGPDTGFDSIGDFEQGGPLVRYLAQLDAQDKLAKTILYNLNPRDNAMMATMIGNFNDGSVAGKMQWGSAWWFLDQKDGMTEQINLLSNMGLLSHFVGMLTDSRSFLSYPRHEYFRRILCNILGSEVERGEIPADLDWLGEIVRRICYGNAKAYFGF
ncbi:MAG: glucuronate isomerase [Bacteroidota bacterium]